MLFSNTSGKLELNINELAEEIVDLESKLVSVRKKKAAVEEQQQKVKTASGAAESAVQMLQRAVELTSEVDIEAVEEIKQRVLSIFEEADHLTEQKFLEEVIDTEDQPLPTPADPLPPTENTEPPTFREVIEPKTSNENKHLTSEQLLGRFKADELRSMAKELKSQGFNVEIQGGKEDLAQSIESLKLVTPRWVEQWVCEELTALFTTEKLRQLARYLKSLGHNIKTSGNKAELSEAIQSCDLVRVEDRIREVFIKR